MGAVVIWSHAWCSELGYVSSIKRKSPNQSSKCMPHDLSSPPPALSLCAAPTWPRPLPLPWLCSAASRPPPPPATLIWLPSTSELELPPLGPLDPEPELDPCSVP